MVDHAQNRLGETITAIATPPGAGGVGIIRISGPEALYYGQKISHRSFFSPRFAHFCDFLDSSHKILDRGLAIHFPSPNSFTGEDVVELQVHGSPVVLREITREIKALGARDAYPGEFSQRAFLNGQLDLSQAEAIASLIEAETEEAARAAFRSLDGELGRESRRIAGQLKMLRAWVEGSLDFPEDDIQEFDDTSARDWLRGIRKEVVSLKARIERGLRLADGGLVVLAGLPNAGKSSLLNALSGRESAIVTEEAGTTRDILRERIQIGGIPVEVVDTAGLREGGDKVEAEGVRRARDEIAKADLIVYLVDGIRGWQSKDDWEWQKLPQDLTIVFHTKGDLASKKDEMSNGVLSVWEDDGLEPFLEEVSAKLGGIGDTDALGARERHRSVVKEVLAALETARDQLDNHGMGDLFAQEVVRAHEIMGEITGGTHTEDILDEIFSSFCVGK